jgi:ANTAR domain-containing protein
MTEPKGGAKGQGAGGGSAARPLADDPARTPASADEAVVRRTRDGWRVGGSDVSDLTSAMVLADLLAAELAESAESGQPHPAGQALATGDSSPARDASETNRLRATIGQLEHALMARVRVEQAIGVLAERHRIQPRQAFEQLRSAARSRGRRVIDIASDVVASATNPLLQLPDELSRPRATGRQARQARGVLGSE